MPLADPTSVYLENLARRRAEAEIMRQQGLQVAQGLQSGIGQMGEAMRIKKSDEDKAAATAREIEQQGVVNAHEAEGLRIRQAQEKRAAEEFKAKQDALRLRPVAVEPETTSEDAGENEAAETPQAVLDRMRVYLTNQDGREPGELPADMGTALSPEAADILERARTEWGESTPGAVRPEPTSGFSVKKATPTAMGSAGAKPLSVKSEIEKERLRKTKADADLAEKKTREVTHDPALANAPPTVLQFWGNVKGTAEQMRNLGREVTKDDFSIAAKVQSQMPTVVQSDRVRRVTSMIDRIVQRAGVSMEGGKLAEGDIIRYRAMLMNAMDSYEGFVAATQEIAAELDQKVADEQAMFRRGEPTAQPAAPSDPQAAFLETFNRLKGTLGRAPTKDEIKADLKARGVIQ